MKIVDVLKQSVFCAKRMSVWAWTLMLFGLFAPSVGAVTITGVAAQQRLSSNGLVDITVTFGGTASDVAKANCTFTATDSATKTSLPIVHITREGSDSGSGSVWTRCFVWDALVDVGEVRIDDVELVVELEGLGGVQLWKNGPYWAECNVGATKPEEYGLYFWWGDTVGHVGPGDWFKGDNCPTYGYGKSVSELRSLGYIDSSGNLAPAHDAARKHLGAPWRMPTAAEVDALISNCDAEWTTRNGANGRLVKGRGTYASKSIFFPAAGQGQDAVIGYIGSYGFYWSSTPNSDVSYAWNLLFSSGDFYHDYYNRYYGQSVRPVRGFAATSTASTHLMLNCDDHKIHFDVNDEWFRDGNAGSILNANIYPATGTMDDLSYVDGRDVTLPRNKYARDGFEFAGWAKAKNYGAVYQDGATIKANELPTSESGLVLYAVWKAKTVVITLDYREWSGASQNIKTRTETTGYGYSLWFPIESSSSDVIDGWYTAPSGGMRVDTGTWWVPTKDTTYYLHWRHKTCTIKYNANGGTGSMPNQSFTMGINQRLSINQFQHDGYVFSGWATSSNGAVVYTDGEGVLLPTAIDGGTVTLYAVWTAASTSANDNFASATAISGSSGATTGSNVGSTVESGEPLLTSFSTATGSTVWWKWTAPLSGSVRIDTAGSSFDTQMGIFTGTSLLALTLVTKDDDGGANNTSMCIFNCTGGITYYICVGGYQGRTGTIKLNWNLTPSGVESDFEIVDGVLKKYKGSGGAVTIPSSVTSIGSYAFFNDCCSSLTSVTIPSSVTSIGDYAFYMCSSLASVTIPSSVTSIGSSAFCYCSGLTSVTIPSSVTSIGDGAFYKCSGLTLVTIPSSVTSIGRSAFYNCGDLTSVTIPSSVTYVGDYAFEDCSALASVTISEGLRSVGICAFRDCSSLTSVTIPSSVTYVGNGAFDGCSSLTAVTIPSSVRSIGHSAFASCSSLASVTIPSSVTSVDDAVFYGCSALTSLTIPSSVTSIGYGAFYNCSGLTSVTIPSSVTSIGESAFDGCEGLETVYVSSGDTSRVRNLMSASGFSVEGVEFVEPATTYTVTFNANGGSGTMTSQTITYGVSTSLKANTFTKNGYAFAGWSKTAGGSVAYDNGASVSNLASAGGSITLYAVWAPQVVAPSAPTGVSATDGSYADYARVTWSAVSGATSYNLYRSTTWSRPSSVTVSGVTSPYNDTTAIPGVKYYYWIAAVNSGGSKVSSYDTGYRAVSLTIGKTTDPFALTGGSGSVSVLANTLWSASTDVSWITMGVKSGNGSGTLTYSVAANPISSTRVGTVTIVAGSDTSYPETKTITVSQGDTADFAIVNGELTGYTGEGGAVAIPSGVTRINSKAFQFCRSLISLTIPASVTSIGEDPFNGCSGLATIYVDPGNAFYSSHEGILFNKNGDGLIAFPHARTGDYVIPPSVKSIGAYAFTFSILTSVTIPDGVTNINDNAFQYCQSLTSIVIPSSVTSLGWCVFRGCTGLTSVSIPFGLTSIGNWMTFSGCTGLTSVVIPPSVTGLGSRAFEGCSGLTSVQIPSSVTHISNNVFSGCRGLTYVAIPPSVTSIDSYAFRGCSGLLSVVISDNVTYIGDSAFVNAPVKVFHVSAGGDVASVKQLLEQSGFDVASATFDTVDYYTVSFDSNDGTGMMSNQQITYCSSTQLSANAFTRNGYTFHGWAKTADGLVVYADGEEVLDLAAVGESITLYAVWEKLVVPTPSVSPADGATFSTDSCLVTLDCAMEGAAIYYTTNGATPKTSASYLYKQPFEIRGTVNVKAVAVKDGVKSEYVTAKITKVDPVPVETPVIAPVNGTTFSTDSCEVTITCPTDGATIYYTTDGTLPTVSEPCRYKGAFGITDTATIKAIAVKEGWLDSACATVTITKVGLTLDGVLGVDSRVRVTTGGEADWVPVNDANAKEGGTSARSGLGNADDDSVSWIQLSVNGKGTLSFWCKTSCEHDDDNTYTWDRVEVTVDGQAKSDWYMDGTSQWVQRTIAFDTVAEHAVRIAYIKDESDYDGEDCAWLDGVVWTPVGATPGSLPDFGDTPSATDVAAAVADAADPQVAAKVDKTNYNDFRAWAGKVKAKGGSAAGVQSVMSAENAWLSYALGQDTLLETVPTDGDLAVEAFEPTAEAGTFAFTVSVKDVEVGSEAAKENLKKVFGLEGAATLDKAAFSSDKVEIDFGTPVDGKVKFTATPKDVSARAFFMKVKMLP